MFLVERMYAIYDGFHSFFMLYNMVFALIFNGCFLILGYDEWQMRVFSCRSEQPNLPESKSNGSPICGQLIVILEQQGFGKQLVMKTPRSKRVVDKS